MKKLAYNINTHQLIYYSYSQDGWLYKLTIIKHGPRAGHAREILIGPKHKYICGIVNINKFLKP